MVETRTPKYCGVCGTHLVANTEISGFDVYTGEPEESSSFSCPNPTVEQLGNILYSRTRKTRHPIWALGSDGVWDSY